jgi:dihydropteroate synthase
MGDEPYRIIISSDEISLFTIFRINVPRCEMNVKSGLFLSILLLFLSGCASGPTPQPGWYPEIIRYDEVSKLAELPIKEGAAIIDIGGESTRPGAGEVAVAQEQERIVPVIEALASASPDTIISIDTSKPQVMRAAVAAGATMINDVMALQLPGALEVVQKLEKIPVCLMHMQGRPRSMQQQPHYENVVEDVLDFLQQRIEACEGMGIARDRLIIDPGFGFGKTVEHNYSLLHHLNHFAQLELPVLAGMSRKSMIGAVLQAETEQRLYGSIAAAVIAAWQGASIIRVHDVRPTVEALKICNSAQNAV